MNASQPSTLYASLHTELANAFEKPVVATSNRAASLPGRWQEFLEASFNEQEAILCMINTLLHPTRRSTIKNLGAITAFEIVASVFAYCHCRPGQKNGERDTKD